MLLKATKALKILDDNICKILTDTLQIGKFQNLGKDICKALDNKKLNDSKVKDITAIIKQYSLLKTEEKIKIKENLASDIVLSETFL